MDGCQRGEGLGGRVAKVKGLVQTGSDKQPQDVKFSPGNAVNNTVVTVSGGGHVKYRGATF